MAAEGVAVTLIDFTLSRLVTRDGATAFCDLEADPELFNGPKGDCQARAPPPACNDVWRAEIAHGLSIILEHEGCPGWCHLVRA